MFFNTSLDISSILLQSVIFRFQGNGLEYKLQYTCKNITKITVLKANSNVKDNFGKNGQ